MKKYLILLLLLIPSLAWGAGGCQTGFTGTSGQDTCNVTSDGTTGSCANADIQLALDNAGVTTGDIVSIPAGTCEWTGNVTIPDSKRITLQGAGSANTIVSSSGAQRFFYNGATGQSGSRVTGIRFNYVWTRAKENYPRYDHCIFYDDDPATGYGAGITWTGNTATGRGTNGLVDHNTFINTRVVVGSVPMMANVEWTVLPNLGTATGAATAVYVEDNIFQRTVVGDAGNCIDGNYGGAYVFRYNTVEATGGGGTYYNYMAHSVQGPNRALKHWEFYGNINTLSAISNNTWNPPWFIRAGTGVVFYNQTIGVDWIVNKVGMDNVRSVASVTQFGQCDGTHPGVDGNEDATGYPCRDQIGRGYDTTLWDDDTPGAYAQPLLPVYIWNNTKENDAIVPGYVMNAGSAVHIQENRDFYNQSTECSKDSCDSGVGCGTDTPTGTCTAGTSYWKTNQSCTSASGFTGDIVTYPERGTIAGTLYKCTATNTWSVFYSPYTYPYPHPYFPISETPTTYTLSLTVDGTGSGTVVSTPSGINTTDSVSYPFSTGQSVVLTGTAATNSALTWAGTDGSGCSGATCTVTMSEARAVTATFTNTPPAYFVVTRSYVGDGVTSPAAGDENVLSGETATTTQTPDANYTFAGWSGTCGCTGTGSCAPTVTDDCTIIATWTANNTKKLTVTYPSYNELVLSDKCGINCGRGSYSCSCDWYNEDITLSCDAGTGRYNCVLTSDECTNGVCGMDADTTVAVSSTNGAVATLGVGGGTITLGDASICVTKDSNADWYSYVRVALDSDDDYTYISESFTSTSAYTLKSFTVKLLRSWSDPGLTITAKICTDNAGVPSSTCTTADATYSTALLGVAPTEVRFSIAAGYSIANATRYHIVLSSALGTTTRYWRWYMLNTGTESLWLSADGSTWDYVDLSATAVFTTSTCANE